MAIYIMTCGACGQELRVPSGSISVICPGCGRDRVVTTTGEPLP